MMKNRAMQVGIDRMIRLAWLERTASLVLGGNTKTEIKKALQHDLCDSFQSGVTAARGSLDKTITILMKVWLTTPHELRGLRDTGLEFLKRTPQQDRIIIHWGMLMAVYPFWANVASQTGRLLKLQGTAGAAHVQRRVREQYGERETVSRAAQRVLRSFVDWDVLHESGVAGVYEPLPTMVVSDRDVAAWLIETVVLSRTNGPITLKNLFESVSLFPFKVAQISSDELISATSRLDVIRHNLDEEMVVLKTARDIPTGNPGTKRVE